MLINECPKAGYVFLRAAGERIVIPTTCKGWRCIPCQPKKIFVMRKTAELGCYRLQESFGRSAFITVTYARKGLSTIRNADTVKADWRILLKLFLRPREITMFRVVELTKAGQPHLHLITSWPTIGIDHLTCRIEGKRANYGREYLNECCECVEHELSRVWYGITGDSWITDVREISTAQKAGAYVANYIKKGMVTWSKLEALGFKRRYSRSNDWPVGRIWMLGKELPWKSEGFVYGRSDLFDWSVMRGRGSQWLEVLGDDLVKEYNNEAVRKGMRRKVEKIDRYIHAS